tara:strand:+ start:109 stop:714 length:606 start_codon:yes stop_codon:yes gene_type:complete
MDLFTTKIHRCSNEKLADKLYLPCKSILKSCSENSKLYTSGKTTFFSQTILDDKKNFCEFYEYVLKEVHNYLTDLNIDKKKIRIKINNSWASEMYHGGYHEMHVHTHGSILSGNFYVHAPHGSGNLTFSRHEWMSDPFQIYKFDEYNRYNSTEWSFTPKKGDMYIWKCDLPHRVDENKNDSRISISFNIGFDYIIDKQHES